MQTPTAPAANRQSSARATNWLYAVLLAYAAGMAIWWPRVFLVVDEERYVSQAVAFAQGHTTIPGAGIIVPPTHLGVISNYPPGTALLQAPFVWAFGWRGAVLLSVLSLIVATLVTARWLRENGKPGAFALVIPGFLGAALFGRIAMSDVPSGALVALACWALWRAERDGAKWSAFAGFLVGASLLFREPLLVLLAPMALGAALRRQVKLAPAIVAGLAAVGLRLWLSSALFGSPWYVRDPGIVFSIASLRHTVPIYAAILLVMFPAGAVLPFFYRGPRRPELLASLALYVLLFLFYDWDSIRGQGAVKGFVLASRFMIPALPLLAWMAADVLPRWTAAMSEPSRKAAMLLANAYGAGVVLLAFAVHPLARTQEGDALAIVRGIQEHTSPEAPVITNSDATLKYLSPAYGTRRLILRQAVMPDSVPALLTRYGKLSVALLDRTDSEMFRADAAANEEFLARLSLACTLGRTDEVGLGWATLRTFDVTGCRRIG